MPCIVVQPPGGFLPSGMILRPSSYTPPTSNNYATITGWIPDPTYPGSMISSNGVVAQGTKPGATITASCRVANSYPFGSYQATIRLLVNGNPVVTGTQVSVPASGTNDATATATVDIASGDVLTVQVTVTSSTNLSVQPTSSYARIT